MNNEERIRALIKSRNVLVEEGKQWKAEHYFESFSSREVSESALMGQICGGVVVEKNEAGKELILHLIVMYERGRSVNISVNKFVAFMKDYELVQGA